jgi:hypothetical protein
MRDSGFVDGEGVGNPSGPESRLAETVSEETFLDEGGVLALVVLLTLSDEGVFVTEVGDERADFARKRNCREDAPMAVHGDVAASGSRGGS